MIKTRVDFGGKQYLVFTYDDGSTPVVMVNIRRAGRRPLWSSGAVGGKLVTDRVVWLASVDAAVVG